MVFLILVSVITISIMIELFYYGKPEFITKFIVFTTMVFGCFYITGAGDYLLNQLDTDMKTTTYYPVVNMSDY